MKLSEYDDIKYRSNKYNRLNQILGRAVRKDSEKVEIDVSKLIAVLREEFNFEDDRPINLVNNYNNW
ncbi:MAG: hypothetical protein N2645_06805 [Clostridia bacterium]|nr:hypothetical protein [Clostridia bacterium]